MDWRNRKYYVVTFAYDARDMRIRTLKLINGFRIHPYKDIPQQTDETELRGHYQFIISVPSEGAEAVEHELRKAERRDDFCCWKEVQRKRKKKKSNAGSLYDVYYKDKNDKTQRVTYFGYSEHDAERLFNSERYAGETLIKIEER